MQFEFRFYFDVKEGRFNDSVPSEIAVRKAGKNIQWRDNSGKGTLHCYYEVGQTESFSFHN